MNKLKAKFVDFTSMTSATADTLFASFNVMAIVGGVLAAIGTSGIFLTGGVREHYADLKQDELKKQTAEAQRDAAQANERTAELNKSSEALKVELEKERKERLQLEQRMAPRRVSEEVKKKLSLHLKPDADTRLFFKVALNNAEGDRLVNEIAAACLAAGWPADRLSGSTVVGASYPPGVTVCLNPDEAGGDKLREPAKVLGVILAEAGLSAQYALSVDPDTPVGTVGIAAGQKPDSPII